MPYVGVDSGWHADFYRCVGTAHFSKAVFPPGLRCNVGVLHRGPLLGCLWTSRGQTAEHTTWASVSIRVRVRLRVRVMS